MNEIELKKGCYGCCYMQYEEASYEYLGDGNYFYCDGRIDEPKEHFKTWPANRKLKCFKSIANEHFIENWRKK